MSKNFPSSQFKGRGNIFKKSVKEQNLELNDEQDDINLKVDSRSNPNPLITFPLRMQVKEQQSDQNLFAPLTSFQGIQDDSQTKQYFIQYNTSRRNSRDAINSINTEQGRQILQSNHNIEEVGSKSSDITDKYKEDKGSQWKIMDSTQGKNKLFPKAEERKQQEITISKEIEGFLGDKDKEGAFEQKDGVQFAQNIEIKQGGPINIFSLSGEGMNSSNVSGLQSNGDTSQHLQQMAQRVDLIKIEKQKVILILIASIIVESCQLVRRGILPEQNTFLCFAASSICIEIISVVEFIRYLNKFSENVQQSQFSRILLLLISQIWKAITFLNIMIESSSSLNPQIENIVPLSSSETIIEAYLICQMTYQIFRNFKIFKRKEEIDLINYFMVIIISILLLDVSIKNLYLLLIQSATIILYILFRLFKFTEFPFSIGSLYISNLGNSIHKEKNNYTSQNNQIQQSAYRKDYLQKIKIMKSLNFSPLLRSLKKETVNNAKILQKKLLFKAQYSLLMNDQLKPSYFSKKMEKIILSSLKSENVASKQEDEEVKLNKLAKLMKQFDKFSDSIIIQRLDTESMKSWEQIKFNSELQQHIIHQQNQAQKQSTLMPYLHETNSAAVLYNGQLKTTQTELPSLLTHQQFSYLNATNLISSPQSMITQRDFGINRNSHFSSVKPTFSSMQQYNLSTISQKQGLKSKYIQVTLKEFLQQFIKNKEIFEKYGINKPIVIASFITNQDRIIKEDLQKFQIKIYPSWEKKERALSVPEKPQSKDFLETKQKNDILTIKLSNILIVLEEVQERDRVVGKQQFYKLLKSIFRCFNNDLTRSLSIILGTSQAGLARKDIPGKLKEQLIRPILLSCKLIKYILHNLRDFNDIVGERFKLQVGETSIPKVAEDSVILFKATIDKKINFKVVINEEVPIIILTDQRRLIQIIITLLSNAHKHTTTGSLTFRIFHPKVGDLFLRSHLRFQVEDTGEGMDSSVQEKLSKIFNSGISYQDFKQISAFGFNLFITNILAKKLFYPEVNNEEDPLIQNENEVSGIKFSSKYGFGSIFYFDIRLFEEKKPEKMQDSILKYLTVQESVLHKPNQSQFPLFKANQNILKSNIFITNSIPSQNHEAQLTKSQADRFLKEQGDEETQEFNKTEKAQKSNEIQNEQISISSTSLTMEIPIEEGTYIGAYFIFNIVILYEIFFAQIIASIFIENAKINALSFIEQEGKIKQDTRVMVFQSLPEGIHSDNQFLRCNCKNILVIDRVQASLDTVGIVLQTFHFQPQKCRSLQEALYAVNQKYQHQCKICKNKMFKSVLISIDEFLKQDAQLTFLKELESFLNNSACSEAIIIVISSSDVPTKKLQDNHRIDDYLSSTFDSIELQNLISKWKLLPSDILLNPSVNNEAPSSR